jgi:hypothetical protein
MTAFTAPQALHDLAFHYARGVDTRDPDALMRVFTIDGVIKGHGVNPIRFQGRDGMERMCAQLVSAFQRTMHNVFNQSFERADDGTITGITYCIASHIPHGDDWQLLDMAILYHNLYAEQDGVWKFAERSLEVQWVETRPVQKFTATMMDADLKEFR